MPSFSDSIFVFVLALLLFGPKKLPVLARELGKWVGEFRRASNEFKMQMEEELRQSEQEDRQKQIAAMEAAAPVAQPVEAIPHPHLAETMVETDEASESVTAEPAVEPTPEVEPAPLPIASAGELKMMPPATGLPTARAASSESDSGDPLGALLEAIPAVNGHREADAVLAGEGESSGR